MHAIACNFSLHHPMETPRAQLFYEISPLLPYFGAGMKYSATHLPSGRPATAVAPCETAALVIGDTRPNPIIAMQTWSALKARQLLEDGTSARIEDDRAYRLSLLRARHPECWAPIPAAREHRTVAEAVAAALPAIRAAVARHTAQGSTS